MTSRANPPTTATTDAPPSPPSPSALAALLLSRADAAQLLGIGTTTLDALIASGELPATRIGRRVLVHRDEVAAFARRACSTRGGDA